MIKYDALSEAEMKHLFTEQEYCDYNLHVEWRFPEASGMFDMPNILPDGTYETDADGNTVTTSTPNSDSGILLRGPDHQANIWNWGVGSGELWSVRTNEDNAPELRAAAVPSKRMDHPIGEWNEFDIRMIGDRITVRLNGKEVIHDALILGIAECGPIGLQHHGGMIEETGAMDPTSSMIEFRNIWIDAIDDEQREDIARMDYPEGWEILFDGREEDLENWVAGEGHSWVVRDGMILLDREFDNSMPNEHYLWAKDTYGDFVLEVEFKTVEDSNSGIFIRTEDIADPVYTGFEVQVNNSYGRPTSQGGTTGTLYDLVKPHTNPVHPPGAWNWMRVFAFDNQIITEVNGVRVAEADLDQWTTAHMNPNGARNKFGRAIRDFAKEGRIGLQDHGRPVWYRHVRIMRLDDASSLKRALNPAYR